MKILTTMLIISSSTFIFMMHPMSMTMNLMIQAIIIAIMTGSIQINYWYSYIMFMIMIGGMMVLIMYMTSIASNEMFKLKKKMLLIPILSALILSNNKIKEMNLVEMSNMEKNLNFKLSMTKFLNEPMMNFTLTIMIYLLITLIVIVKITNLNEGPLRQKF
uniref:NADH-ubiquinone oxidoreductase chain 6 n=1 Tax=Rhyzopertha dominica TaxID=92692 RepID=A0A4V1DVF4_RHYDO|nr:NADH dehydrogenase subunit 6 [Rhyzopertha dominica]QCI56366.1 NADH dehydrogenase subunit 6 [Rhyzopertha dominica]